jgi:hypothetical protein
MSDERAFANPTDDHSEWKELVVTLNEARARCR